MTHLGFVQRNGQPAQILMVERTIGNPFRDRMTSNRCLDELAQFARAFLDGQGAGERLCFIDNPIDAGTAALHRPFDKLCAVHSAKTNSED